MYYFILKRSVISFFIMLAATTIMYFLTINSGDPFEDLGEQSGPEKAATIAARTAAMNLDVPPIPRYFLWLQDVGHCLVPGGVSCTLGQDRSGAEVLPQLMNAMGSTLRLVVVATVLALVLGVIVGIVTAILYTPIPTVKRAFCLELRGTKIASMPSHGTPAPILLSGIG